MNDSKINAICKQALPSSGDIYLAFRNQISQDQCRYFELSAPLEADYFTPLYVRNETVKCHDKLGIYNNYTKVRFNDIRRITPHSIRYNPRIVLTTAVIAMVKRP